MHCTEHRRFASHRAPRAARRAQWFWRAWTHQPPAHTTAHTPRHRPNTAPPIPTIPLRAVVVARVERSDGKRAGVALDQRDGHSRLVRRAPCHI
eukprot:5460853-Prymnesium_polylepis.1